MDTDPCPVLQGALRDYRAISSARDGRVTDVTALDARCDADAIAQADALVRRDLALDLWDGLRLVEHFTGRRAWTIPLVPEADPFLGG
jgi:hypothetical protein